MRLTHRRATLRLEEPFTISRSTSVEEQVLWVELAVDGAAGFGEAQPQDHYGETIEGAEAFLDEAAGLLGDDPFALEAVEARLAELPGNRAAKAAVDAALHDLCGKLVGQPVWRLLGLEPGGPPSSWTIWLGDPDDMAHRAEAVGGRFRRLKLKLGGRDGLDVERVRAVRGVTELP
ncbi:MAG: dipeptide epimerase, partial [Gaiellaceae bacterium]